MKKHLLSFFSGFARVYFDKENDVLYLQDYYLSFGKKWKQGDVAIQSKSNKTILYFIYPNRKFFYRKKIYSFKKGTLELKRKSITSFSLIDISVGKEYLCIEVNSKEDIV